VRSLKMCSHPAARRASSCRSNTALCVSGLNCPFGNRIPTFIRKSMRAVSLLRRCIARKQGTGLLTDEDLKGWSSIATR
jgi:hypothetical protein